MATYAPMSARGEVAVSRLPATRLSPDEDLSVEDVLTGPKYAELLGVPLLRGREIEIRDTASAPRVAVVNSTFAEHFFKDQNPVGRTFTFDDETDGGAATRDRRSCRRYQVRRRA